MNYTYCLDLGTAYIKMMNVNDRQIKIERNAVGIRNSRELFAAGNPAYEMFAKSPENIEISFPMKSRVIADSNQMAYMLEHIIDFKKMKFFDKQYFVVAVPTDITDVERRAFAKLAKNISRRTNGIGLVEMAIADCVGIGIHPYETKGTFIVDMGADATSFSVVSDGGVSYELIGKSGGKLIDSLLQNYIRKKYNVELGLFDSESLKIELGDALNYKETKMSFAGNNVLSARPQTIEISSQDVYKAIKVYCEYVVRGIKKSYMKLTPQLRSAVNENGIYLTGGLSRLHNVRAYIKKETNLTIHGYKNPDVTIVSGLKKIYERSEYEKLIMSFDGK